MFLCLQITAPLWIYVKKDYGNPLDLTYFQLYKTQLYFPTHSHTFLYQGIYVLLYIRGRRIRYRLNWQVRDAYRKNDDIQSKQTNKEDVIL